MSIGLTRYRPQEPSVSHELWPSGSHVQCSVHNSLLVPAAARATRGYRCSRLANTTGWAPFYCNFAAKVQFARSQHPLWACAGPESLLRPPRFLSTVPRRIESVGLSPSKRWILASRWQEHRGVHTARRAVVVLFLQRIRHDIVITNASDASDRHIHTHKHTHKHSVWDPGLPYYLLLTIGTPPSASATPHKHRKMNKVMVHSMFHDTLIKTFPTLTPTTSTSTVPTQHQSNQAHD